MKNMKKMKFNVTVEPSVLLALIGLVGFITTATGHMKEWIGFHTSDNELIFALLCLLIMMLSIIAGVKIERMYVNRYERFGDDMDIVENSKDNEL